MPDIKGLAAKYYTKCSELLDGKTVKQIDSLKEPTGIIRRNAWSKVRLERLNEERQAKRVSQLRVMFPTITEEQLELVDLSSEPNDRGGLVIKLKTVEVLNG